jgi:hypothetical protein
VKIYLAARYSRRDEMRNLASELVRLGHFITSRWILGTHEIGPGGSIRADDRQRTEFAIIDYADVMKADAVISFTEPPDPGSGRNRGGRHVEFGIAIAARKRVIVVGYRENVFHHLPLVEFYESQWDLLRALAAGQVAAPEKGA